MAVHPSTLSCLSLVVLSLFLCLVHGQVDSSCIGPIAVCDGNSTEIFPSFCRYHNPFLSPTLFSDTEIQFERFEIICEDGYSAFNNSANQNAQCWSSTAITSVGARQNSTWFNYILLGMVDQEMLILNFNTLLPSVTNVFFGAPVRFADSCSLVLPSGDIDGFVIGGSIYGIAIAKMNVSNTNPSFIGLGWTWPPFYVAEYGGYCGYRGLKFFAPVSYYSAATVQLTQFPGLTGPTLMYNMFSNTTSPPNLGRVIQNVVYINPPVFSPQGAQFLRNDVLEHFNFSSSVDGALRIDRTQTSHRRFLSMLYDGQSVSLYNYDQNTVSNTTVTGTDTSVITAMPCNVQSINFGDKSQASQFYQVDPGESITVASILTEEFRRFDASNSTCSNAQESSYPAAMPWIVLSVALANNQGYQLRTIALPELAQIDFTLPINPQDPAQRVGTPWQSCGIQSNGTYNYYWDKMHQTCLPRPIYTQSLPEPAVKISVRFRDLIQTEGNVSLGAFSNGQSIPSVLQDSAANCAPFSSNTTLFATCQQYYNTLAQSYAQQFSSCPIQTLQQLSKNTSEIQQAFSLFLYNTIFVSYHQSIGVFSLQQQLCSLSQTDLAYLNAATFIGRVLDFTVSASSQHLQASLTRDRWQIRSRQRFLDICSTIQSDPGPTYIEPGHAALQPYAASCADARANGFLRNISLNDFSQALSSCPPGSYCPSLVQNIIEQVPLGSYTARPQKLQVCEPGYFCRNGTKIACPQGFFCSSPGLDRPQSCPFDPSLSSTCAGNGTVHPFSCAQGSACIAPYFPPMPASPGYYFPYSATQNESRTTLFPCAPGDWCSLGRYNGSTSSLIPNNASSLLSPAGVYTSSPDALSPVACGYSTTLGIDFCPAGTIIEALCPLGSYCNDTMHSFPCSISQYCPLGTVIAQPCPQSYYCPSPSERILCPEGSYCVVGSIVPQKCPFLSDCPAGSSSFKKAYLGLLLDILVVVAIFALLKLYLRIRDKKRDEREQNRQKIAETVRKAESSGMEMKPIQNNSAYITAENVLDRRCENMRIDFTFEEMGLQLASGKKVLNGVTGACPSGVITAVMGPSGAGKTTFLSTLSGKASYGTRTGKVFINGQEEDIAKYRRVIGFVPQAEIMHRQLTVKENILFNANLRLPKDMDSVEKRMRVRAVIEMLGLTEIRHSEIGDEENRGISGGQAKRVNIGMEVVADPAVLFLDEPTSGLDSASSLVVCRALREVAQRGVCVILVLHQPRYELFKLFHRILLLGKGGKTVFLDDSEKAIDYFALHGFPCPNLVNPPDFFLDVINGDVPRENDPGFKSSDLFDMWAEWSQRQRVANGPQYSPALSDAERNLALSSSIANRPSPFARNDVIASSDSPSMYLEAPLLEGSSSSSSGASYPSRTKYYNRSRLHRFKASFAEFMREQCSMELSQFRATPSLGSQILFFFRRGILQQVRSIGAIMFDLTLCLIAGVFLGLTYSSSQYQGPLPSALVDTCTPSIRPALQYPVNDPIISLASLCCLALGMVSVTSSLRVFNEKIVFWREAAAGLSPLAYFLGKMLSHVFYIFLAPAAYLSVFFSLVSPRGSLGDYYVVLLTVTWAGSGLAYLATVLVPSSLALLFGVITTLILSMFSGTRPTLSQMSKMFFPMPYISNLSYIRWAQEGLYLIEVAQYADTYNVSTGLELFSYSLSNKSLDLGMVVFYGALFRFFAYLVLLLKDRDKRR